jgi:hypothetical protein
MSPAGLEATRGSPRAAKRGVRVIRLQCMRMNEGIRWRSPPGEGENTYWSAGATTARTSTPFQETYDKADDDKNRLDGMKLCKKT